MLVTNIYNMADTYFVSELGNSASGAVGVVFGLMAIIQAFGFMFGHGAGSIIARKLGQKDTHSASVFASLSVLACLCTGTLIGVLGLFGVQSSQAIADVLAFIISAPLVLNFLNKLPEDKPESAEN